MTGLLWETRSFTLRYLSSRYCFLLNSHVLKLEFGTAAESEKSLYFDFYGQGKYNTDRTDLTAGSAGYYNVEEVKERYGDRVDFIAPPLLERVSRWLSKGRETVVALWH